jgi:UDP-N-acetylmuramate dehydrogenase
VVLAAVLRLGPPEPALAIQERMEALAARRKEKFPANPRNCGSVFRRAEDGTPAAVYIDRAGCKGLREGRCQVAPEHANWIVNLGGATAAEVRALIARLQDEVKARFGVELQREVVYLPQDQKEIP